MTDEAISEGFRSIAPGEKYDGLFRSAQCRSQADWLVGMNATRAFTLHEGKNLDFVLQLRMHLTQHGLYILEASIPDHHAVQAPLRVSRGG